MKANHYENEKRDIHPMVSIEQVKSATLIVENTVGTQSHEISHPVLSANHQNFSNDIISTTEEYQNQLNRVQMVLPQHQQVSNPSNETYIPEIENKHISLPLDYSTHCMPTTSNSSITAIGYEPKQDTDINPNDETPGIHIGYQTSLVINMDEISDNVYEEDCKGSQTYKEHPLPDNEEYEKDTLSDMGSFQEFRNSMISSDNSTENILSFIGSIVSSPNNSRKATRRMNRNKSERWPSESFSSEQPEINFISRCSTYQNESSPSQRLRTNKTSKTAPALIRANTQTIRPYVDHLCSPIIKRNKTTSNETILPESPDAEKFNPDPELGYKNTRYSISDDSLRKRDFIIKLSKALVLYGSPTYRVEYQVEDVSNELGIDTHCFFFPGLILISFGEGDHRSSTHMVKSNGGFNMEKLCHVNRLCNALTDKKLTADEAIRELEIIKTRKRPKGFLGHPMLSNRYTYLFVFPVHAFSLGIVAFGFDYYEATICGLLSFLVAVMVIIGERFPYFLFVLDFVSALIVSFVGRVVQWTMSKESGLNFMTDVGKCFNFSNIVICALAMLLPGLSLTVSMVEIATKNMVSGTVRMFNAFFTSIMLGFGMSIGSSLVFWVNPSTKTLEAINPKCSPEENIVWMIAFFPSLSLMSNYFFKPTLKQYPIMFLSSLAAVVVAKVTGKFLKTSPEVPAVVSSFAVGLISNIYARIFREPAMAPLLSGILMLVPGTIAVKSTLGFLGSNVLDGTSFAFQMLIIALSITVGLFISTLMVWPTKPKSQTAS